MVELHINGYTVEVAEPELQQFVGDNVWMFDYRGKTYFHPDKFAAARNKTSAIWMDAVAAENVLKSLSGLVAEKPKVGIFSRAGDSGGSKRLTIPVFPESGHSEVWFPERRVGAAGGK